MLNADPSEDEAEALYAAFSDGTITTIVGVPQIHFHREAETLQEAIRSAINDVRSAKIEVERVEFHPEAIVQAT